MAISKSDHAEYLAGEHWRELRKAFLADPDNSHCSRCSIPRWLAGIAYDQDLHVHHRTYKNKGNEDWDDLQSLCRRCHEIETFGRSSLRAPKEATCDCCGGLHWDPYSHYCRLCLGLIRGGGDNFVLGNGHLSCYICGEISLGTNCQCHRCGATDRNSFHVTDMWRRVLLRILLGSSQDQILDKLGRIESFQRSAETYGEAGLLYDDIERDGGIE